MTTTDRALAAFDLTIDALLRLLSADLTAHGVRARYDEALPLAQPGEVKVGDLVLVFGYQRWRFARVWNVTPSKLSAIYLTPSALVYPNCVTVRIADAALVESAPVAEHALVAVPATADADLQLVSEGDPRTSWIETGQPGAWRREVTEQTYRVECVVLIERHGRTYRVDTLLVNVDDTSDTRVVLVRQRKAGGDFAKRDGMWLQLADLPELADRVLGWFATTSAPIEHAIVDEPAQAGGSAAQLDKVAVGCDALSVGMLPAGVEGFLF